MRFFAAALNRLLPSIPHEDRKALLKVLRKSECRILALRKPGDPQLAGVDHSIDVWDGPEALTSAVRKTWTQKVLQVGMTLWLW